MDGFWFVPGAVALGHVALAIGMIRVDRILDRPVGFSGDAGAARGILETIAGSLITVAGLAFSLTIVVLALVSSQFSPRAVPGFLADRLNQVIAGTFVGIFGYCMMILASVRGESAPASERFIPYLSVTVAICLALTALGLLLIFIHHMGTSIQVSRLAARIAGATTAEIDRFHPDDRPHTEAAAETASPQGTIVCRGPGYVQTIDLPGILAAAPGLCARVTVRGGDFVTTGTTIAEVRPDDALTDEMGAAVRRCIVIAKERSVRGDVLYGVRQLADIATKALSPGINDPTTAIECIGYLRDLLERLAARHLPDQVTIAGPEGGSVSARRPTFEDYLAEAFDEIRRYASDNARVVVSLLDALGAIARAARESEHAGARAGRVVELAEAVALPALASARTPRDTRLVEDGAAWTRGPV